MQSSKELKVIRQMFLDDTFIQVEEEAALINYYLNSKKAIK